MDSPLDSGSVSLDEGNSRKTKVPHAVVVMGVSACGKSTIGKGISDALGIPFEDGDHHHPESNISKMKSGIPLNDDDRKGWLETLSAIMSKKVAEGTGVVIACSALKLSYRNILRTLHGSDDHKVVDFVYIHGSFETFEKRMSAREGHFMPATLLKSQFEALQTPKAGEVGLEAFNEGKIVTVEALWSVDEIVESAKKALLMP